MAAGITYVQNLGPLRLFFGTSYPSASGDGTYEAGDIIWNQEPSAGEAAFWVCVAAGTPGTWQKLTLVAV